MVRKYEHAAPGAMRMSVNGVRFPNDSNRHAIIGATGSGKTMFGMWSLSRRSFDTMPWVIFDYKREELIAAVDPIEIDPREMPPKHPGLYVLCDEIYEYIKIQKGSTNRIHKISSSSKLPIFADEGERVLKYFPNRFARASE